MPQHDRQDPLDTSSRVLRLEVERLVACKRFPEDHYCVGMCVGHHLGFVSSEKTESNGILNHHGSISDGGTSDDLDVLIHKFLVVRTRRSKVKKADLLSFWIVKEI